MLFSRNSVVAVAALALSAAAVAQAQEDCPVPDDGICQFDPVNPVKCGPPNYECFYDNFCLAGLDAGGAGFDVTTECCQAPLPSTCTTNFDPVICGDLLCPYDNQCIATLAGYAETQCTAPDACPPPPVGGCDFEPINPVKCNPPLYQCEYDNFCLAGGAGFDVTTECCQAPIPSNCPAIFDPVICGDQQCPFDNTCLAELSGYDLSQCFFVNPKTAPPTPAPAPIPGQCPDGVGCDFEPFNPVKCNPPLYECGYDNFCLANSAGWLITTECCQAPLPGACTTIFDPVICGDLNCPYDNSCEAENSGFDLSQCFFVITPAPAPQPTNQCPDPAFGTCPGVFAPVFCGPLQCQYDNSCLAELAGFDLSLCTGGNLQCPSTDPNTSDCGFNPFNPVKCRAPFYECFYDNYCFADEAGFEFNECCQAPLPSACPSIFEPVICGDLQCPYDNTCLADLAGYTPAQCNVAPSKPPSPFGCDVADPRSVFCPPRPPQVPSPMQPIPPVPSPIQPIKPVYVP